MIPPLPTEPGAYRWFYADLTAGDLTAVVIFMVGAVFSPDYSRSWRKGARPLQHCAVNFALYRGGARRLWVLTEYPGAGRTKSELFIGHSRLALWAGGGLWVDLDEQATPGGDRVKAQLTFEPLVQPLPEQTLVAGAPHFWQPLAARARGRLELPGRGLDVSGHGYCDTNHGAEPLGGSLPGWTWLRTHTPTSSRIGYWPRTPAGPAPALGVEVDEAGARLAASPPPLGASGCTGWGLSVPARLDEASRGHRVSPRLLESSPFYARLETTEAGVHRLAEVADFARFHRPSIRWMAHFRTRRAS